jgi:serine/threonine-protein kinase
MARTFANLPGYAVHQRIGRGAGALIYEALSTASRQRFAVKHVVRRGPSDDRFIEQAEREFEVGSRVNHPFLRKAIDLVRVRRWLKTAELFLVLEYVPGERLEDRRPHALEPTVRLFIDVAAGLSGLHRIGYAHADIKPNNILLTRDGVKLIDFGQSCPLGHTKERIQGTPDYMAPEQVLRQPIDQRTDVFNLGATMYWVLTGKWFRTLMSAAPTGAKKIEVDARSGVQPPHVIDPQIPVPLSQTVMDCCQNDKNKRPWDMAQVTSRLEAVLHLLERQRGSAGQRQA